jgi:hypothetical protein
MIGFEYGTKKLFGINWNVTLSGNDFSVNTGEVRGGIPIYVYQNTEFGTLAFAYIENPENIKIKEERYNDVLDEIHRKDISGKPILIYYDEKYKDSCSEWNNKNNTLYLLNEFENLFL